MPYLTICVHRIPDIMRYYKDLIINAQHEVFLATNYWEQSWGSHLYAVIMIHLALSTDISALAFTMHLLNCPNVLKEDRINLWSS